MYILIKKKVNAYFKIFSGQKISFEVLSALTKNDVSSLIPEIGPRAKFNLKRKEYFGKRKIAVCIFKVSYVHILT